jgi:hypothetical protein
MPPENPPTVEFKVDMVDIPTHCPLCKAEIVYHQHPLRPPGVIIAGQCKCKVVAQQTGPGTTTITMVPPQWAQGAVKEAVKNFGMEAVLDALVGLFPLDGVPTGGELAPKVSLQPYELQLREDLVNALELYRSRYQSIKSWIYLLANRNPMRLKTLLEQGALTTEEALLATSVLAPVEAMPRELWDK